MSEPAEAGVVVVTGESADVARAVDFFIHRHNGFFTGQVLYVCGGTSVGSLVL